MLGVSDHMEYRTTDELVHGGCGVEVEVVVNIFLSWRSGSGIMATILGFVIIVHLTCSKDWQRRKSTLPRGSDTIGHGVSKRV